MIEFAWSPVFLTLVAPFVLKRILRTVKNMSGAAVKVPFFLQVKALRAGKLSSFSQSTPFQTAWLYAAWFFLVCAATRPQLPLGMQEYRFPVRDIVLAIDISASMKSEDFKVTKNLNIQRLDGVQNVADGFISKRKGDRIGLVVFGGQANLYVPLTLDYPAVRTMLHTLSAGLLGGMTAIGDAIGLSVKYLKESQAQHKVVVLLTDGLNNAGNVMPLDALKSAIAEKVRVYVIGVGNPDDAKDGLDERLLKTIAAKSGGAYYFAGSQADLKKAYDEIADAEPLSKADAFFVPKKELYPYPLFVFLTMMSLSGLARLRSHLAYERRKHDEF